jgi:fatty acid desaturase
MPDGLRARRFGSAAMTIDRIVLAFAGTVVLLGLLLGVLVSPWWLLLAGFVGLNLLQSAFTGFCPLARILKGLGIKPGAAFC